MTSKSVAAVIQSMPANWATCPIYRKGAPLPKGGEACGKSPLGKAHHDDLSPAASAVYLEVQPEIFGAVGAFAGARSGGLVILDVDANLTALTKKWGKDLANAPRIDSPKKNAAKFLFQVPQEHWASVAGVSLAASKEGYEILWGRQGVIAGAYHAGGEYTCTGDLQNVPVAPDWLLARMQLAFKEAQDKHVAKKNVDTRYSRRTREEKVAIAEACLSVIPAPGRGSEDLWWRIGAMLHSELPGEDGLNLWREWSLKDEEYADDWANGQDPCLGRWEAGFSGGGLGFGSLVTLADHHDPDRVRLKRDGLAAVVAEAEAAVQVVRQGYISGEELVSRARELEESIDNPALLDQAKHLLGLEAGRKDGASAVDRLLDAALAYERTNGAGPQPIEQLNDEPFEYLIPGLLPKPWTLLIHADGGTGKTAMCQTIAKHLTQGKPFNVHGGLVPVPQCRVLWLNGDQNERIVRRQFAAIGVEQGIHVVGEWDMAWYRRFVKYQRKNKYDLVVIDSLDGCNDSNPYEENRREYAMPLKRLARRNGVDFPACSIIVIHHNTKNGGFRGTSAIRAAVDETWNMKKVEASELMQLGLSVNSRIVTVEKSRDDREGQEMVFSLLPDYTYSIAPVPANDQRVQYDTPNQHMLDMLEVMRLDRKPWCASDFYEHPTLGGMHRKRAVKYGLKKLEDQKLIEKCEAPEGGDCKRGRPKVYYCAVGTDVPGLSRGKGFRYIHENSVSKIQTPSAGTDLKGQTDLSKIPFVKNQGCTTGQIPASEAVLAPDVFDKGIFDKSALSNQTPCAASDLNFDTDFPVNRVLPPEVVQAATDAAWEKWATKPMSEQETLETIGDLDGCVDVSAEEV